MIVILNVIPTCRDGVKNLMLSQGDILREICS